MKNMKPPLLLFIVVSVSLGALTVSVTGNNVGAYLPTDDMAVDCGSSSNFPGDKRTWIGDAEEGSRYSPIEKTRSSVVANANSPHPCVPPVPYYTACLSRAEFTYTFHVTAGPKFVRLHFFPSDYLNFSRADSFFSVEAAGFTLLRNFSASLLANYTTPQASGFSKEFCLTVGDDQILNITFAPTPGNSDAYAFVNGIEVVSMPERLYYNSVVDSKEGIKFAGHTMPYSFGTTDALEMVKRLNVGGNSIDSADDTGMYRTWDADDFYVTSSRIGVFLIEINNPSDRLFEIFIDSQLVEGRADIISWSGKGVPVYRDYAVYMPDGQKKRTNLSVAVGALPEGVQDGILNGLEIFKISNSDRKDRHRCWRSFGLHRALTPRFLPLPATKPREGFDLKAATNNFDQVLIIGVGGFGNVYKGYVDGGATQVAIKRLNPGSQQGLHEFMTEIEMLSHLRHLHLVSLIGFCNDAGEMILVYDYMARGTLRDHLYNTDNPPLPWKQRLEICMGAARGLHYLHTGAKHTIIHRDMKTTNRQGGTFGYLDPEYYRRQQLTDKSDVYSFGVVLFEVLCVRPAVNRTAQKNQISLAAWAQSCCNSGDIEKIVDPHLKGAIAPECLNKVCEIAMSCLQDEGAKRPSMNEVVWSLEFALQLQMSAEQEVIDHGVRPCTTAMRATMTQLQSEATSQTAAVRFSAVAIAGWLQQRPVAMMFLMRVRLVMIRRSYRLGLSCLRL
ncbi:hypothetical protein NL676_005290 [Syzygium grande]|nr:hypothetical protein NL676_005290 [Syzygium grande]